MKKLPLPNRQPTTLFTGALAAALGIAVMTLTTNATAQNLVIPVGQQGESTKETPGLGMNKAYVERTYGAPKTTKGPVGEPPISTWEYDAYTVYFEYDTVIHTVLRHQPTTTP